MMKFNRVHGIVIGGLVLGLIGLVVAWWFLAAKPVFGYKTAQLERGRLQATVSATGILNPQRQVQISSQVSGQIKELWVDFNSAVKEGQLIARLDPETFQSRVQQASADVRVVRAAALTARANLAQSLAQASKVEVDLEEAQRDWQRKQDLVAQSFVAAAEADKARAMVRSQTQALKAAQALVDVARAQLQSALALIEQREAVLQQAQVDVRRTEIRSPVDGIVIKRTVEVGQTVAASLQAPELFLIARNLHEMQIEASIDEADVAKIKAGQKATFTIDAFPRQTFEGQVIQVRQAAISVQNVTTYAVIVGFSNTGDVRPLPGMTANVRIVTDVTEQALKLPNAALRVRLPGVAATPRQVSLSPPVEGPVVERGGAAEWAQLGQIFVMLPGAGAEPKPQAYTVRLGITDGLHTELLPTADQPALKEGAVVIVGTPASSGRPASPRAGPGALRHSF